MNIYLIFIHIGIGHTKLIKSHKIVVVDQARLVRIEPIQQGLTLSTCKVFAQLYNRQLYLIVCYPLLSRTTVPSENHLSVHTSPPLLNPLLLLALAIDQLV